MGKVWTKEEALITLRELIEEIEKLRPSKAFSSEHTRWIAKCQTILEEVFGSNSRFFLSFIDIGWRPPSGTPIDTFHYGTVQAAYDAAARPTYLNLLDTVKGLLLGAIDYLEEREIKDVYTAKESGNEANVVLKVLRLVEQKLRIIIREKPEKEKQIQDAFENLLIGADIPYGKEVDSIVYSTKTYIPDFSLPDIDLAVEVKLCNRDEREKELPEEINDDILAYQTKYKNLLFIIYDLGFIRDIERFCSSFEKHGNVTVRVIKH